MDIHSLFGQERLVTDLCSIFEALAVSVIFYVLVTLGFLLQPELHLYSI
jgi:hypothetical protein